MKKNVFFPSMVVLTLLFLVACKKENGNQMLCAATPNGDTLNLKSDKPVSIFNTCSPGLEVTLVGITDDRCPKNVQCFSSGILNTVLLLNNKFLVVLEKDKQKDTTYQNVRYSFLLVDVTPYPEIIQISASQKSAQIIIKKK